MRVNNRLKDILMFLISLDNNISAAKITSKNSLAWNDSSE